MASKMPKKITKPSAPCDTSAQTAELQTKVKKLQAELEAERWVIHLGLFELYIALQVSVLTY